MARQGDACWRCGTVWATEATPKTTLRLIQGNARTQSDAADRWANEGGSVAAEVRLPLSATAVTS